MEPSVETQVEVCRRVHSELLECARIEKLGIALQTLGKIPVHGLRKEPENGTCGWYIWCGDEFLEDSDFFKPLHVSHINNYLPQAEKYLGLAPGHRFIITENYEDIWYDSSLLSI
jgi:hypothetical protein